MDCEYFLGAGQHSEKHLWAGNRHAQIAKMRELYEMIPDKPEWLTPEMINSYEERMAPRYLVAAYHHFENGFDDKLDYYTLEEAEKAAQGYVDGTMEDDGFKYDGAAVYDQQEHKCIRIYGDYPDEKAHAQVRASAEPEQQEPEHFIDHFYVAEDIQKRGALDIKEYSSFDDALRAYYALPDTQRKALGAMNTRDLPGSLDFVQCVDGKDTIIQDYAQVDGWQNAEVMDIIAQLEQSITTREIPPVPAVNFHITDDNIGEGGQISMNIRGIKKQILGRIEPYLLCKAAEIIIDLFCSLFVVCHYQFPGKSPVLSQLMHEMNLLGFQRSGSLQRPLRLFQGLQKIFIFL